MLQKIEGGYLLKRSEDFALLLFDNGVLYNNVFVKSDIQNAFQQVFLDGNQFGWEWNWPENSDPSIKTYPEVILGRSPWSKAPQYITTFNTCRIIRG